MSNKEKTLVKGLYFNKKHENAPSFVLGAISINKGMFQNFIEDLPTNKDGYCKFDMLKSQGGKIYFVVNEYGTEKTKNEKKNNNDFEETEESIPF